MMALLHVSANTPPLSGRLYTNKYKYSKFCRLYLYSFLYNLIDGGRNM